MAVDVRLKTASELYHQGCTCSQAVFCAFADELGLDQKTIYRIAEGFGAGFGGMQEVCGAFTGAVAVISYCLSSGSMDGESKEHTYQAIQKAAEIFAEEYGSIRCREILQGDVPKALQCGMKIKDAILITREVLSEARTTQTEKR